jgi:hypothetical protein
LFYCSLFAFLCYQALIRGFQTLTDLNFGKESAEWKQKTGEAPKDVSRICAEYKN